MDWVLELAGVLSSVLDEITSLDQVAGACNHPNWLTVTFRIELIRAA